MINLNQIILTPEGKEFEQTTIGADEKTTVIKVDLKRCLIDCLLDAPIVTEDYVKEKMDRYEMYINIKNIEEVEFAPEQKTLLKQLVAKRYDVYYTGYIINILSK